MENFVLPKKWCIKRTIENSKVLNDWSNKTHGDSLYLITDEDYIFSDRCGNDDFFESEYTRISFEQFEKYVLMEGVKIAGYKAPYDLLNEKIKKGDLFKINFSTNIGYHATDNPICHIPKEIVETWEPVYEERLVIEFASIGTKKVKISNEGKIEGTRSYTIEQWENLFNKLKEKITLYGSFGDYSVNVETVSIGCEHGIKLYEIENLIKLYYELNPKK